MHCAPSSFADENSISVANKVIDNKYFIVIL